MALNSCKTQFVQPGESADFLASADKISGDPIQLPGGRAGIVNCDTASGQYGSAETRRGTLYRGVKATGTGTALTAGQALYWNATSGVYAASGNFIVGTVHEAAETADDTVLFALNILPRAAHVADASAGSAAEINALRDALVAAGLMASA